MSAFLDTPKGYTLVMLFLLTVVASFDAGADQGWINIAAAVGAAVVMDLAFAVQQQRRRFFPDGAVLTGLIVALVLSTSVAWYGCAVIAGIATLSKHLLKVKRRPIFNPAAVGLAAAILLFGSEQSWWGGLSVLPAWCIAFVLIAGMLVTHRVNKFPQVFAFLGVFFSLLLVTGLLQISDVGDLLRVPLVNAVLFLAFFMITDPPTSPARYDDQVVFGMVAAGISVIDYMVFKGLSFLLVGLLIANGWNAWRAVASSKVHAQ